MDSWLEWLSLLGVDFFMLAALFAGCLLMGWEHTPRNGIAARVLAAVIVECLWAYPLSYLWLYSGWTSGCLSFLVVTKYLGTFVLTILAFWFCCRCGFFTALFCGTTAYILQHCSERALEILQFFFGDTSEAADHILLVGITAAVYALYARLFLKDFSVSDYEKFDAEGNHVTLITAVAAVGVVVVLEPLIRGEIVEAGGDLRTGKLMCYINTISLLLSVLALIISMCQLREAESIKQNEITQQLLHNERKRYALEKETVETINIKCHDIRHQIAALEQSGTAYQRELRKIGELVDIYDCGLKTENTALDLILSSKSIACSGKNITLTCVADGRKLDFMAESDLYALFGNILDNAIEAVEQMADAEMRLITLTVQARQGFLFINAENYYSGELCFERGLPQTTKADKQYHGFGMRSIQMLTEKYGGDLQVRAEDGIYTLSIMLPIKE